ncbi:MAG: tRNA (N(6)-L-threonylcarbamoyladenosine(37)-C(2))-methylthiotransferase MtaB [Bacteroidales bacterium]|nr:tRNA (N(6)-L-threonylcarbamoyladenosine(37)-C(2))-methylthiotransferase MtaB [Bacteroidales bacterium]
MVIAFLTLGCKLNYAETSTYERGFRAAGLDVVPWQEKADVYLVNTCTVTGTSDAKSRNLVRKVHRVNPDARIVVTGCSAELHRAEFEAIEGVVRVFGAHEKSLVVPETLALLGLSITDSRWGNASSGPSPEGTTPENCATLGNIRGGDPSLAMGGAERSEAFSWVVPSGEKGRNKVVLPKEEGLGRVFGAYSTGERTRSFLKVQDGCNNYCKYCTVPYARGESRNIPVCECVKYAEAIAAEGVKEVVLTGVNTGDFGRTTGESFLDLLKALNGVEGIERYRISSIEPNLITEEIVDWIASGTKFQPHFHIPLQTGSDTLLKAMGRHYDTVFFADRIAYIRSRMEGPGKPKVFFGIDTMVGLPGETEELFRQTYDFIAGIRPAFIHVFPYSRRPGTPAATMPGQVPERVKHERVLALEELCARLHSDFVEANRGIRERVLFESKEKDGNMSGYTGNYIRIVRPYDEALVGRLTDIII